MVIRYHILFIIIIVVFSIVHNEILLVLIGKLVFELFVHYKDIQVHFNCLLRHKEA